MPERLQGNPRILIKDIPLSGEIVQHQSTRIVATAITPNRQLGQIIDQALAHPENFPSAPAVFCNRLIPIHVVLKNSQDSPKIVADTSVHTDQKGEIDGTFHLFSPSSGITSLNDFKVIVEQAKDDEKNAVVMYDALASYHPAFAQHPQEEVQTTLREYFSFLKTYLKHGAYFLIQLEEDETDNKNVTDSYNKLVLQALAYSGFNAGDKITCQQYSYERESDHSIGTLYVFVNRDYALGEHDPEEKTSVPNWMKEVDDIVEAGFEPVPVRPLRREQELNRKELPLP